MNSQVILPGQQGGRAAGHCRRRSSRGQAIAEGAAMMPLIIMLAVFMIMFLMYVGFTLYYQVQLGFIANQVANYAANKLTGDPNSDSAFLSSGELLSKAQELGNLVGINVVKVAHKPTNPTTSIGIKVTMQNIEMFNGKLPTLPNSANGAALLGASPFKYYGKLRGMCAKKDYGGVDWVNTTLWVPCYKSNRVSGSVPAQVEYAGGWGVNCTAESSANNVWGIGPGK